MTAANENAMDVIGKDKLARCMRKHAEARDQLAAWLAHVENADWQKPEDVQRDFGSDSILPGSRAVFNIKGRKYRVVVVINYGMRIVLIRFAGTPDEYNRIDGTKI
jgi:mRNA interferase HigB